MTAARPREWRRNAGAAFVVLMVIVVIAYLAHEGHGPFATAASRHLSAMKHRRTAPDAFEPITFAGFDALPRRAKLDTFAPLERRGVSLDGYVQRMAKAGDGDFHFEIVERPGGRDRRYVTVEITPFWRERQGWTWERLVAVFGLDPRGHARDPDRLVRVRLSGWLMDDYWIDWLPRFLPFIHGRITGWEIHPVTRIEVWDAARGGFVEAL